MGPDADWDFGTWNDGAGAFTIEFWAKWSGDSGLTDELFSITDLNPGYGEYQQRLFFRMFSGPTIHYEVANATGQSYLSADIGLNPYSNPDATFGNWFHIAVVRGGNSSNNVDIYVDGYLAETLTMTGGGSGPEFYWER